MDLREFLIDFYGDIVLDKLSQKNYSFIKNFDDTHGFCDHVYETLKKLQIPAHYAQDELEGWLYERLESEAEELADTLIYQLNA